MTLKDKEQVMQHKNAVYGPTDNIIKRKEEGHSGTLFECRVDMGWVGALCNSKHWRSLRMS